MKKINLNFIVQIGLTIFTLGQYLLTAIKFPQYGLIVAFVAQIFWLYSSYKGWKEANQFGMFITSILMTAIVIFGIINYWFL